LKSVLSLITILFLLTSSIPFGFAETTTNDSTIPETLSLVSSTPKESRNISVSLHESVGIASNSPQKKSSAINPTIISESEHLGKTIYLSEELNLISSILQQTVGHNSFVIQPQATLDRISPIEQIKDRKKNSKIDLLSLDDSNQHEFSNNLISFDSNILKTSLFTDPLKLISDSIIEQNFENNLESINIFENESFENLSVYVNILDPSFLFDNSFVILIFTPLAFFLFIFSEDVKFKIEKIRPVLSFVLVFIILSTVVVTPYSISSSYWPEAYADTGDMNETIFDNTTASTDDISSSSTPAEDTSASEATTSNTDTSVDSTSSSSTPAEDSESTEVSSSTNATLTVIPVNGTVIPVNGTVIPVNGTVIPVNGTVIPVNGTVIPGTNSTNSTGMISEPIIIPNATESWSFDTQINGSRFVGDVHITESNSSLILDGDGYLANDGNSTSTISDLSVTAWVNPDYSGGSAEFTVISKEGSFALTINNNIEPQKIASFSVFDGIKWHTVQSIEKIGDEWSHIAGTFNGTTLSIYTNGTHSNTNETIEKITLTIDGKLEAQTIETIESTSDVVIGAALENTRSVDDVTKQFNGQIKEVDIFNLYLTAEQIQEIYTQTLPLILQLQNNTSTEIIPQEESIVIDIFTQSNSTQIISSITNTTTPIPTNTTETMIEFNGTEEYIPITEETLNDELNKLTISTWINPDYTSGSAEFTVVSKENSFVLGINNVIAPERVATFAIFDGVQWTKITGVSEIRNWTHLAGVINGTELTLYVNGTKDTSTTLPETFVISEGEIKTASSEVEGNNSDLIIGAYLNTIRGNISLSNHFAGIIDDVLIYKEALSEAQLDEMYAEYTSPDGIKHIPFASSLLSFTDIVSVTLGRTNSTDVIVASVNATSNVPSAFQKLSFSDYISYKLNDSTFVSSSDVVTFEDVVVATIVDQTQTNSTVPDEFLELSSSLSIQDTVLITLNGQHFISLEEIFSINATIISEDDPLIAIDSNSNITLSHDIIEINKPVTWNHDVIFSNNSQFIAVEIPADAEILTIKTMNDTSETFIFDSQEYPQINSTHTGLYDDEDISEKDLTKQLRLLDSVQKIESKINSTNDKIEYYASLDTAKAHKKLDKLNTNLEKLEEKLENKLSKLSDIPLASLQQVDEMLQEDKPLKVLLLNGTDENVELTFTTPAPIAIEHDNSTNDKFNKKVTVSHESALHYTNVTAYSDLPEDLVEAGTDFKLFWNINNTRVNVTNDPRFAVEFVDTNANGIVDQMKWIVPQLSEQEFDIEADLEIINVQSYPAVGGNWKVKFTTNGTADLVITAVNGTTFGTVSPDDLTFLELNNGTHTLNPIVNGNTITFYNYSSTEEGFEESTVLTAFKHHLMFQFGNKTAFAHNSAFVPNGPEAITLYGSPKLFSPGTPDNEDDLALDDAIFPGWDEPALRQDAIFTHNIDNCSDQNSDCISINATEAGTYRVNYGLTADGIGVGRYSGVTFVQNDTDGLGGYGLGQGMSCYDSSYSKTGESATGNRWSGECLVNLDANGSVRIGLSKVSSDAGTGSIPFDNNENWFSMVKVENPVISLRATGESQGITNVAEDMIFEDEDIVIYDTSTFSFNEFITPGSTVETFSGTAGTGHTMNLPSASVDDVIFCAIAGNPDGTGTVPNITAVSGFTEAGTQTNTGAASDGMLSGWYRVVQGGDASSRSVTFSQTGMMASVCTAYTGVDTSQVLDVTVPTFDTTENPPTSPAITTVSDGARIITATLVDGVPGFGDSDIPAATTLRGTIVNNPPSNGQNLGMADLDAAGAKGSWNWGAGAEEGVSFTVVLRPAVPGTAVLGTDIQVEEDGFYKVSYSVLYDSAGQGRTSAFSTIQTDTSGSFQDSEYGRSLVYVRDATNIDLGALSGSAIFDLNADDIIRLVTESETADTLTATDYHIDVEYIGTSSSANVLRIYDSTGGVNVDDTLSDVLIDWDTTSSNTGSHFTFTGDTTPTDEITINNNGLYHISYAIDADRDAANNNDRFKSRSSIEIDEAGGSETWNDAIACTGNTYSRGQQTAGEYHQSATLTSSCLLELGIGDKIRVVSFKTSQTADASDYLTVANQSFLTIHALTVSIPPLQDSNLPLTAVLEYFIIKNAIEPLSLSDTVITIKSAVVELTEDLSLVDSPIFVDKDGQVLIQLEENLDLDADITRAQVLPISLQESLSLEDTINRSIPFRFTESLGLSDVVTAERFIPANPDFKIQHGTFIIPIGSLSATIAGTGQAGNATNFDQCTGECFIMQTSTRQSGMGPTTDGYNGVQAEDFTTYISNVDGLTSGGTVTVERSGIANDNRIAWQIIEYIGPAGGPNEMKVLNTGTVSFGTSDAGKQVSGITTALDDDDVAVIITGVSTDGGASDYDSSLITTEWRGTSDAAVFNRTAVNSVSLEVSYAVVEFSGNNWNLQRVEKNRF